MYIWIPITILAAIMQTTRTSLQKSLKVNLSSQSITWIRYLFGLPIVVVYILILGFIGLDFPVINRMFIIYSLIAGFFQILGTILLVSLFSHRNFAVSTAYAKTEAIQVVIIGTILFDQHISFTSTIAILIGVLGVILISLVQDNVSWYSLFIGLRHKYVLIGICCVASFSIDALLIREAILILEISSPVMGAATSLLAIVIINLIMLGGWILITEKDAFRSIYSYRNKSALVGLTSALGSIAWFSAFALTEVAYVKAVGQIEVIFSILVTQKLFKEGMNRLELLAVFLIGISILVLVYSTNQT